MGIIQDFLGYVKPNVLSPDISPDTVARALRGLRDGTLSVADFKLVCALEGVLYQANVGSLATPVAGHTQANFNQLQPDFNLDVPVGKAVIMFPPNLHLETSAGTLNRVIAASTNQLLGAGTSSPMTVGPTNTRSDRKNGSTCKGLQAYTANVAALANVSSQIEHWRSGYAFADATGAPVKVFQPDANAWPFPLLVGPASFQVYWVGTTTAPSGFLQVLYAEFDSNRVS